MNSKPYERVQIFSGGGSRFGYYLGSYAALVDHKLTPDMIIGTCGGSLSAYLVQLVPHPEDLHQLMCSETLYRVIRAIRHVAPHEAGRRLKTRYMTQALKRWRLSRQKQKIRQQHKADSLEGLLDELQTLAMFRIENEQQWLDALSDFSTRNFSILNNEVSARDDAGSRDKDGGRHIAPEIAIIASRLYSNPMASGVSTTAFDNNVQPNVQLQELLFAPPRLADYVAKMNGGSIESPAYALANGRIQQAVNVLSQQNIEVAVRASMADMYYLPPTHIDRLGWCLGGVINLTPIELACRLGNTVFAESKSGYDSWLAAPAIQRVFGFDPNERLVQVHDYDPMLQLSQVDSAAYKANHKTQLHEVQLHWLPFADNAKQLAGKNVQKRFNIKQMTVELIHADYAGFVQQMQAQWQYGYQRTVDYIQQHKL
ncbi:patatin-like phospholipase family protein [Psychrobacter sp.]|uniref:patatin-like phospholipase family protein n=1 Tax=Psychrobacter sp. TaxID=56811 RepID=UPI003F998533